MPIFDFLSEFFHAYAPVLTVILAPSVLHNDPLSSQMKSSILNTLQSESTAFLGALWARCAQSAPRKAVD